MLSSGANWIAGEGRGPGSHLNLESPITVHGVHDPAKKGGI